MRIYTNTLLGYYLFDSFKINVEQINKMEKNFERGLINYLYHDINRMMYFVKDEIFEYDIQSSIHNYLRFSFDSAKYKIAREINGKVDHVIMEKLTSKTTLIEVKSFIKNQEKFNYEKIKRDIEKTSKKIKEINDTEGYLILISKQSQLKSKNEKSNELIKLITGKNQRVDFGVIKTRLVRSYRTLYEKENKFITHKSQIRVFMFQIINKV
jgi:hypothetical protein